MKASSPCLRGEEELLLLHHLAATAELGGENLQAGRRMIGHEMTAALTAIFTLAQRRLGKGLDVLGAFGDAHGFRLPQAEGIHRPTGPRAAGAAMAIAHRRGFARDLDRDRATEA